MPKFCTLAGEFNSCSARRGATIRRLQRLWPANIVKEVVMFRKTIIALATVAALGAVAPTAADARGGFGGGFHGGGFHGGGFGGGRWHGGGWGLGAGALAGAVIGGAIASSAYGYYGPYYGGGYYPGYSYYPADVGYSPYYDYGPWQAIQEPGAARFYRPYGYGSRPWGYW
jgi:hypothetical protein